MNWILIQQVVVSIMAVVVILSGIIGLIKVVPEINQIVKDSDEDKKIAAMGVATRKTYQIILHGNYTRLEPI